MRLSHKIFLSVFGVAISLALSGCNQSIGRFEMIYPDPLPPEGIAAVPQVAPAPQPVESCINSYFIFQTEFSYDLAGIVHRVCENRALTHVSLDRHFWLIPLVYGHDCLKVQAQCAVAGANR